MDVHGRLQNTFLDDLQFFNTGQGIGVLGFDLENGQLAAMPEWFYPYRASVDMNTLIDHLNAYPDGTLMMIGIGDDAAISGYPASGMCTEDTCSLLLNKPWKLQFVDMLKAMGSELIDDYCFRNSWSMIAIKGAGNLIAEDLKVNGGAISKYSFEVSPPLFTLQAPDAPVLSLPDNGAMIDTIAPNLQWDLRDGANTYHLQIATDSLFNNILQEDSNIIESAFAASALEFEKQHYWRVRSMNTAGKSRWSCIYQFAPTKFIVSNTEIEQGNLKYDIFPNPVSSQRDLFLRFHTPYTKAFHLEILDIRGQLLYKQSFTNLAKEQNLSLPSPRHPGVYFIHISNESGFRISDRFIVQ